MGALITTTEVDDHLKIGFSMIKELLHQEKAFGGRGVRGPSIIMTDDGKSERGALAEVFPEAVLLLCQFHVLQSTWRYVWNTETGILKDHRILLFSYVKKMVYATTEDSFNGLYNSFLNDTTVQKYQKFIDYVRKMHDRRDEWSSYPRTDLITRGQNTNNICEAAMKVSLYDLMRTCQHGLNNFMVLIIHHKIGNISKFGQIE